MPEELYSKEPLAIIGEEDIVIGFRALGFKTYAVTQEEQFKTALDEAINKKPAICLIQDNIYCALEDEINSYRNLPIPIFIPFGKDGSISLVETIVKDIRLKATGRGEGD